MKNNISKTLLFLLVFLLLFSSFTHLFIPKDTTSEAGMHDSQAKAFLAEPENTLDVVVFGNSEVYTSLIPLEIWGSTGIAFYSCGSSDQMLYQTEDYLRRVFEVQSPKLVLLQANLLFRNYNTMDVLTHSAQELFPLIRYHDRWKNLNLSDLTETVDFRTPNRNRGFFLFTEIVPADDSGYMAPSDEYFPIPSKNIDRLETILTLCRENNAELVLFTPPSIENWGSSLHNSTALLAEQWELPYYDLNLLREEIPINWETESMDGGDHLNYWGAMKVSSWISNYLVETGLFEDKRNQPEYTRWNQDLEAFRAETETLQ